MSCQDCVGRWDQPWTRWTPLLSLRIWARLSIPAVLLPDSFISSSQSLMFLMCSFFYSLDVTTKASTRRNNRLWVRFSVLVKTSCSKLAHTPTMWGLEPIARPSQWARFHFVGEPRANIFTFLGLWSLNLQLDGLICTKPTTTSTTNKPVEVG